MGALGVDHWRRARRSRNWRNTPLWGARRRTPLRGHRRRRMANKQRAVRRSTSWLAIPAWCALWLAGAALQLFSGNNSPASFTMMLRSAQSGAPEWLAAIDGRLARLSIPGWVPAVVIALSVLVGVWALVTGSDTSTLRRDRRHHRINRLAPLSGTGRPDVGAGDRSEFGTTHSAARTGGGQRDEVSDADTDECEVHFQLLGIAQ